MNLDGGGSSAMILARSNGYLQVVNSPPTKVFGQSLVRPIPVALRLGPVASDHPE